MPTILNTKSLYYKDVNLIGQKCKVKSRSEILREYNRIFISPMSWLVGEKFAKAASDLGLTVCLHRFNGLDEQIRIFRSLDVNRNTFISLGLDDPIDKILEQTNCEKILIDVANGYMVDEISKVITNINFAFLHKKRFLPEIIVGNIHSNSVIPDYRYFQNKIIFRVGIANGQLCDTEDSTGYNRGQITEIIECSNSIDKVSRLMIADGGIKSPADCAKAFGAGADYVMLGSYFKYAEEAEVNVKGESLVYGMASEHQLKLSGKKRDHSEGKVYCLDKQVSRRPLKDIITELTSAINSAVSYSGHKSWTDFIGKGVFEIR